MDHIETLKSPRLLRLEQELAQRNAATLDRFWDEVTAQGTPLIERIDNEPEFLLVTFLWRDEGKTDNVVLLSVLDDMIFEDGCWDFERSRFQRLAESNVWYRTYRLPHDARFTYQLSPNDPLTPCHEVEDWSARRASWQSDPLNRRYYATYTEAEPEQATSQVSVVELPNAPSQPWLTVHPETPTGQVQSYQVVSKIFGNERRVWVYTPPGYTPASDPYGLVLTLGDWASYLRAIPMPTILDNLLAAGQLPPVVALVVDITVNRFEALSCNPALNDFLVEELLPWAEERVHLSSDPRQRLIAGCSLGGAAATFAGLSRPDHFGNVLSQDGAFWVSPGYDARAAWLRPLNESPEPEWLAEQFAVRDRVPLRLYLETGRYTGAARPFFPGNLTANRHLRNILRAKGYEFSYREYTGGHEFICWRGSFADGLVALLGPVGGR